MKKSLRIWVALVALLLSGGARAQDFNPRTDYPTGFRPTSVAVGDFNADGKPDLAVANYFGNTVSVLLSDGAGGFLAKTDYPTGANPNSVAVGDFNADGKPDLATANYFGNTVSVLPGDGAGGFLAGTDYNTGTNPYSVAVGDFNADGKPDLAVANNGGSTVSVLPGDGAGGFLARTDYPTGELPTSVAVGDLNADGRPDLAVANSNTVSVLLSNGAGSFNPRTDYPTGSRPIAVAVGDFTADGKPDLAVANYFDSNVSVLPGNGAGGFLAKTDYPTGGVPVSVAVGDFNADGKPDLAVANDGGNVSVLLSNGAGSFNPWTGYPTGIRPVSVAVGDFNADGRPDLATANYADNTVSVLLNATCTTPTAYAVTGGGAYCAGGSGRAVDLDGSEPGVNYQLKRDNSNVGTAVAGTGGALSFGIQTIAGTYTVTATNATTSCVAEMTGSASVSVNPLPTAYAVSGGGAYCAGGAGLAVGLTNSQSAVNYQLKRDNNNAGTPVAGTGAAISFGNQTLAGTYTVTATNATTSCTADMSGSATVSVIPLPTASIGGNNGPICAGGNAIFTVSGSSGATLTYTLTGLSGNQTLALNGGSQTITASAATANATLTLVSVANANCSQNLTATSTVTVNALPSVNAGPDQSVILGSGSNCTNLTATPSGGSGGNYGYTWTPGNGMGQTVTVCPTQTTTYTVTLTDGNGCKATDQVIVNVRDVRCGPGGQNVSMCYYGQTICVPQSYVARYQSIGATLGACGSGNTRIGYEPAGASSLTLTVKAYPNPTLGTLTVEVQSPVAGAARFEVLTAGGQAVQQKTKELSEGLNEVPFELGAQPTGNYLIRCVDRLGRQAVVRVNKQ